MKTSTRFILLIIFVLIVAGGVIAGVMILNNHDNDDETQEERELTWEEEYAKVLEDEENFKDVKDLKISLNDLNKDETPELIVFCTNAINEFMANIYNVKDKKVEKTEVKLNENFDFEYMYDAEKESYDWYIVTETKKDIYEVNLENDNVTESNKLKNKANLITIGKGTKTDFDKLTVDETKTKEIIETAKNSFVKNNDLQNTEEAKAKVESAKIIKNVKKIDLSKDLVYSEREYETDNYANVIDKTFHNYYEYPAINIDSEEVKAINAEIKQKYGFTQEQEEELFFMELEVTTYDYYINDNVLSVVVMHGGNDSTWTDSYNVDLATGKKISNEDLLGRKQMSSSEKFDVNKVKENLKEHSIKEIDKSTAEMKKTIGQYWDESYEVEVTKLKEEVNKNLENLDNVYLNSEGHLCCRSKYQIFGGQWTCTKTIEIDTTNNNIKEIKFEDYLQRGLGKQNT